MEIDVRGRAGLSAGMVRFQLERADGQVQPDGTAQFSLPSSRSVFSQNSVSGRLVGGPRQFDGMVHFGGCQFQRVVQRPLATRSDGLNADLPAVRRCLDNQPAAQRGGRAPVQIPAKLDVVMDQIADVVF